MNSKQKTPNVSMRVSDVNWTTWQPQEVATLMFITQGESVLLIRKKRGLGAGKINGPGGKLEGKETPMECAIRETNEELLINPINIRAAGELFFHSDDMPRIHGHVFVATNYQGTPTETDEAIPLWFDLDDIPFDQMWDDDRLWLSQVLSGQSVLGYFTFIQEKMLDYKVEFTEIQKSQFFVNDLKN